MGEHCCRCKPEGASDVRTGDRPFTEGTRHVAKLASGSDNYKTTVIAYVLCLKMTFDAAGLPANASSRVHKYSKYQCSLAVQQQGNSLQPRQKALQGQSCQDSTN